MKWVAIKNGSFRLWPVKVLTGKNILSFLRSFRTSFTFLTLTY